MYFLSQEQAYRSTARSNAATYRDLQMNSTSDNKPLALELKYLEFSTPLMYNVNILWTKKSNIKKYTTFCGGINEDGESLKKIIK